MDTSVHHEVASVLLRLYPKLSLDVYEGEEYYGEYMDISDWHSALLMHQPLKPGVGNRPVITYAHLSQVDQIA